MEFISNITAEDGYISQPFLSTDKECKGKVGRPSSSLLQLVVSAVTQLEDTCDEIQISQIKLHKLQLETPLNAAVGHVHEAIDLLLQIKDNLGETNHANSSRPCLNNKRSITRENQLIEILQSKRKAPAYSPVFSFCSSLPESLPTDICATVM